jgi:hypothetical protein
MLKLGRVILLISCISCLSLLCHLLSLDMLCVNATCLVSISYMWIMQCHLVARHYICELYNGMLFSQASCMWIISCHPLFVLRIPFVDNVCIFNYSSCASAIWIGDGKIWSENKVFRANNATCWSRYLAGCR